jgi:hypothetical protein
MDDSTGFSDWMRVVANECRYTFDQYDEVSGVTPIWGPIVTPDTKVFVVPDPIRDPATEDVPGPRLKTSPGMDIDSVAIWNRTLTEGELATLADGFEPGQMSFGEDWKGRPGRYQGLFVSTVGDPATAPGGINVSRLHVGRRKGQERLAFVRPAREPCRRPCRQRQRHA